MGELRARTAGPADFALLLAIEPGAATDVNRQRFLRRSVNANECYLVERDESLVAFGVLNYSFFDHGLIASIMVAESVRYAEIVTVLLRYMESRCRTSKLFAKTANANSALQTVLRKLHYHECGSVRNIGDDDQPDLFFYKFLEPDDSKIPAHHFGLQ